MADEIVLGSGGGGGGSDDASNAPREVLERRLAALESAMDSRQDRQSHGLPPGDRAKCDLLSRKFGRTPFTLGDACDLMGKETPEECNEFLEQMCWFGCIDEPKDMHGTLGRRMFRMSRQSVVDAVGIK